jgi:hypothetical protein
VVWTLSGVEGVPAGHIVHFILDAVEQLPITDFRVKRLFALKNLAVAA